MEALRESSPQARHHFTQADQVNQLVSANEADPDLGFMARLMALCSLPRSNPGQLGGPLSRLAEPNAGLFLSDGQNPRILPPGTSEPACFGQRSRPRSGLHGAVMALCSLPRSNPGNRKEYNGPFTLYMQSGPGNKLPYGNFPRLLLAWLCTEVVGVPTVTVQNRTLRAVVRTP